MEAIDRLEHKLGEVLSTLEGLRRENARLRQEAAEGATAHEEERARLQQELAEERAAKEEVLARIDALLDKLSAAPLEE